MLIANEQTSRGCLINKLGMINARKRLFTLLELLIVMFILSLGASVAGVKLKEAYDEQRFLSEVDQITSHLQMAQDLMLIMDTDVYFYLIKDADESISYYLKVAKPLVVKKMNNPDQGSIIDRESSLKWAHLVERQIPLHAVRSFAFINHDQKETLLPSELEDRTALQKVILRFSLMKMSTGELILASTKTIDSTEEEKSNKKKIVLTGYPCAIQCQKEMPQETNRIEESRSLYPKY